MMMYWCAVAGRYTFAASLLPTIESLRIPIDRLFATQLNIYSHSISRYPVTSDTVPYPRHR
jgi:hypothetical protein